MWKRLSILILLSIAIVVAAFFFIRHEIFAANVERDYDLFIKTGSSFDDVLNTLEADSVLRNPRSFSRVSGWMKYVQPSVPSGRYTLQKGMSNRTLIGKLRSGDQDAVKVTFNGVRKIENLAGEIASYLEVDSNALYNAIMAPETLEKYDLNVHTILTLFIPNTYNFYWNTSAEKVVAKLESEWNRFWQSDSRDEKARALGLTRAEVYTLASIVEKESNYQPERPTMAGVYLNRLKQGIHLQADPTVVFAVGKFDLRRVLNIHLKHDSPFNTYLYAGLPPGPITMPSINSIDAVLNAEDHDYLFFCAKPGYNAGHSFARTNAEHERNAREYRAWLNSERIR